MEADAEANAERLGDIDALLWAVERDPRLSSTIGSVCFFEPAVDPDLFRARAERVTHVVPRLRQRVVGNPLSLSPPRWEFVVDFDLDNHVVISEWPGDGSDRALLDYAAPAISGPFDRNQPLWRFELLHHPDGKRSALILKAHHAIADGLGMLMIQAELFAFEGGVTAVDDVPAAVAGVPLDAPERLANALRFERRRGMRALQDLVGVVLAPTVDETVDRAVETAAASLRSVQPVAPLSPALSGRSSSSWIGSIELSLSGLKAAGRAAGTRMNAAFVAGVAIGLGRFHDEVGQPIPRLRMGMPVSRRTEGAAAEGNFFAPVRVEVPVTGHPPVDLIQIIDALVDAQRDNPALDVLGPASDLLTRLPAPVSGALFAQMLRGSDFLTSNVPGSPLPMYLGDATLLAQYPFGPTNAAAVNVTLLSYQDLAHVGVSIDESATDQPQLLCDCIQAGLDEVLAVG